MRLFLFFILLLMLPFCAYSQSDIVQKMAINNIANPTTNLFVHFDKNIYSNNETVYFTAYILKTGKFNLTEHKILAVALIKDLDTAIIKAEKFLVQDGLAFGNLIIPDSINTGNYHLLAYTDKLVNGKPELIFKQPIIIKTNIDPPFKANINFLEKPDSSQGNHKLIVSVTSNDNKLLPKPTTINYRYGKLIRMGKTDLMGQLTITIPKEENDIDPNIYLKLKNQKDSIFLTLPLTSNKIKAKVKFYPEGGNLVNNTRSMVSWEVTDQYSKPLPLRALLYKNDIVFDTIETNSYGIGQFYLVSEESTNYTVKIVSNNFADSCYNLPKALKNGLVMNIQNVVANDTLRFTLRTTNPQKIFIRVHNFRKCFLDVPFNMETMSRKMNIPLHDIPKGINTVTITDSLDRPLAERLFFAHYDNREIITIQTDSLTYKPRQKVTLKLTPKNLQGNSIVSIAVTQENRFTSKNNNDIESYFYIKNEIENIPIHTSNKYYKDKDYLKDILLVRGWRRYTWQQIQNLKYTDTLLTTDSLTISGLITKDKKPLTSPINLTLFGGNKIQLITTNANGNFNLSNYLLDQEKRAYLSVDSKNLGKFDILIKDNFVKANIQLLTNNLSESPIYLANSLDNLSMSLTSKEKATRLKEVTIKNNNDNSFFYSEAERKAATRSYLIEDYICVSGILNCPNHVNDTGNRRAPSWMVQMAKKKRSQKMEEYNEDIEFSGVRYHKEFYTNDYKDPTEPALFSTIYWNYGTILSPEKSNEISFYTSDITGKFKIVIQGAVKDDVIYTEKSFEVKN